MNGYSFKHVSKRERIFCFELFVQTYLVRMDMSGKAKLWPLNFHQSKCQVYHLMADTVRVHSIPEINQPPLPKIYTSVQDLTLCPNNLFIPTLSPQSGKKAPKNY